MLGISDPEDLWPVARLDYLRLYLADDPEPGLRAHVQAHPEDVGRVLPYLLTVIDDRKPYVSRRTEALLMLARIGSARAVPRLIEYVERRGRLLVAAERVGSDAPNARDAVSELQSAVYALGRIGDPSALPVVRRATTEWIVDVPESGDLRETCERALRRLEAVATERR